MQNKDFTYLLTYLLCKWVTYRLWQQYIASDLLTHRLWQQYTASDLLTVYDNNTLEVSYLLTIYENNTLQVSYLLTVYDNNTLQVSYLLTVYDNNTLQVVARVKWLKLLKRLQVWLLQHKMLLNRDKINKKYIFQIKNIYQIVNQKTL